MSRLLAALAVAILAGLIWAAPAGASDPPRRSPQEAPAPHSPEASTAPRPVAGPVAMEGGAGDSFRRGLLLAVAWSFLGASLLIVVASLARTVRWLRRIDSSRRSAQSQVFRLGLNVRAGAGHLRHYSFESYPVTVSSAGTADLLLPDPKGTRQRFRIDYRDGCGWFESESPRVINGVPQREKRLREGDRILFGSYRIDFDGAAFVPRTVLAPVRPRYGWQIPAVVALLTLSVLFRQATGVPQSRADGRLARAAERAAERVAERAAERAAERDARAREQQAEAAEREQQAARAAEAAKVARAEEAARAEEVAQAGEREAREAAARGEEARRAAEAVRAEEAARAEEARRAAEAVRVAEEARKAAEAAKRAEQAAARERDAQRLALTRKSPAMLVASVAAELPGNPPVVEPIPDAGPVSAAAPKAVPAKRPDRSVTPVAREERPDSSALLERARPQVYAPGRPVGYFRADVLFIHAHPDDESLDFAVLMSRAFRSGKRAATILFTDGEAGLDRYPKRPVGGSYPNHALRGSSLASVRVQEAAEAMAILGSEAYVRLGLMNRPYNNLRDVVPLETVLEGWGGEEALVERLVELIRGFQPQLIVAPDSSSGAYEHFEHEAVGYLVKKALSALDREGGPEVRAHLVSVDPFQRGKYSECVEVSGSERDPRSSMTHRAIQALALQQHVSQADASVIGLKRLPPLSSEYYHVLRWEMGESLQEWLAKTPPQTETKTSP